MPRKTNEPCHCNRIDPDQKVLFSLEMNPGLDILTNTVQQAEVGDPTSTPIVAWI